GWPGAVAFYSQSNVLSQGNVIYQNGGEGHIFWGTEAGFVGQNNVARHNVIFDNFSVNLYVDKPQGILLEQNFVFQHPRDPSMTFDHLFALSSGYDTDFGRRMAPINLSLGDEPGSSSDGQAHLADVMVINNIFAGGKRAF